MSKVVAILVAALFVLVMMAPAVRADSLVAVGMSNLTFMGTSGTETVSISFLWDVTNSSIDPGTMSVAASGAFGEPFSFANNGPDIPVGSGEGFLWVDTNTLADEVSLNTCGFNCGMFPSVGSYNTIDVTMLCGPTDTCSTSGFQGVHPSSGTFTVSAVPEPSSLPLLVFGLAALALLRRRRQLLPRLF